MSSVEYFRELFDYDYWANLEAIRSMEFLGSAAEHGRKVLGHIIGAQRVWLGRFEASHEPAGDPWPSLPLEDARRAVEDLHARWSALLGRMSKRKLGEDLRYRNMKGEELRTPVRDVLTQLIVHGAYHRGQIATVVRDADAQPALTDYVVYVRKKKSVG